MAIKLTDAVIKRLPAPAAGKVITYDTEVKGFGARVYSSGARSFVLNYRTRSGRERRITIGAVSDWNTAAARAEARELKKLIDRGGDPLADIETLRIAPTVSDLCDRFVAEYLPRKRPSTQYVYRLQIDNEIRRALGRLKVAEVTFADTDALHREISRRGTLYYANRVVALLSRMFTLAMRWQWRADNPCRGVERNLENKRRRYLTPDELVRLGGALDAYADQQAANIIRLMLLTGCRRGEAQGARWADFDSGFTTWCKPGSATKQKREHVAPLSSAAQQLLRGIRARTPAATEWVFSTDGPSHRYAVDDAWAAVCRAAKIDGCRLHDLRHSYASILAGAGVPLLTIGQLLGHQSPTTTARYSHLHDDPLRAATEAAGAIISNGRGR
jgi:integrase